MTIYHSPRFTRGTFTEVTAVPFVVVFVGAEEIEASVCDKNTAAAAIAEVQEEQDPNPEDLEYVKQIKMVKSVCLF
ncbi:hypothetical protein Ancab_019160 [Ancistrocladus abbreviatus]